MMGGGTTPNFDPLDVTQCTISELSRPQQSRE